MGLIELLRQLSPFGSKAKELSSERGEKSDRTIYFHSPWIRYHQRKTTWNDLETMDLDEPIVARGLDFTSRFATKFPDDMEMTGFKLEGPDNELAVLDPLAKSICLDAFEFVRYMLKLGDCFGEVVVEPDALQVTGLKLFPYSYQIQKNVDHYGNLLTGNPEIALKEQKAEFAAYDQLDDTRGLVAAFWPYQIAHFGFGHKQGKQYHEPYLGCVISAAKRLAAMKDGLSIARLTRAYQKLVHMVPIPLGSDENDVKRKIKEYKEMMGTDTTIPYDTSSSGYKVSSREAPMSADTAFYIPRFYDPEGKTVEGSVTSVDADSANLENLDDVYLLVREVLCAIGVPADFLNYSVGQRSFIDKTTPEKRESFLYLAASLQSSWITTVRWVLDMQLLLNGINPLSAQYKVVPPHISPKEAEVAAKIDLQRANTAAVWWKLGIPREVIGGRVLQLTPAEVALWSASEGTETPNGVDPDAQTELWKRYALPQFADSEVGR